MSQMLDAHLQETNSTFKCDRRKQSRSKQRDRSGSDRCGLKSYPLTLFAVTMKPCIP